jgi:glucan phosphoethanolaminetransferase (alkaline phosphatase superfamily)
MTKPKLAFILLVLISVAAVAFAFYYRVMAGVFMHDSNFQTFQETLSEDQKRGILWSLRSVATGYTWLLVITNVLWLVGAWYFLSRLKGRHDDMA